VSALASAVNPATTGVEKRRVVDEADVDASPVAAVDHVEAVFDAGHADVSREVVACSDRDDAEQGVPERVGPGQAADCARQRPVATGGRHDVRLRGSGRRLLDDVLGRFRLADLVTALLGQPADPFVVIGVTGRGLWTSIRRRVPGGSSAGDVTSLFQAVRTQKCVCTVM